MVKEWIRAIVNGPGTMSLYHQAWIQSSGVAEASSVAHEHRFGSEFIRLACVIDQLDVSNLPCVEHLVRRIVQLEKAVMRNARFPDFSGLDVVMAEPTEWSGAAIVPAYTEYTSTRMKDQAQIWKNTRLYRDERPSYRGGDDDDDDDDDSSSGGGGHGNKKGNKNKKTKKKDGKGNNDGGAGDGADKK